MNQLLKKESTVFISYAHGNGSTFADYLAAELQKSGIRVCYDKNFDIGLMLPEQIAKGIDETDYFLLLMNQDYFQSGWCRRELFQAITSDANKRKYTILPILISPCEVPSYIKPIQWFTLSSVNWNECVAAIVQRITGEKQRKEITDKKEEHYYDNPITNWLSLLKTQLDRSAISKYDYWKVLDYIYDENLSRDIDFNQVLDRFLCVRNLDSKLFIKGKNKPEDLYNSQLTTQEQASIHQILSAIYFQLNVKIDVLGITFILIPPATFGNQISNINPFYVAKAPISKTDWCKILDNAIEAVCDTDEKLPKTEISLIDIDDFLRQFTKKLKTDPTWNIFEKVDYPNIEQWRFMTYGWNDSIVPERGLSEPILRTKPSSHFGLFDLIGLVNQICRCYKECHYEAIGGSYRDNKDLRYLSINGMKINDTYKKSNTIGFRPILYLKGYLYE